jgi:hypothetical protein
VKEVDEHPEVKEVDENQNSLEMRTPEQKEVVPVSEERLLLL